MRIVRLANFVTPRSGGLRTAVAHLGAGYRAAGHDPVLVVPGARHSDDTTDQGRVITLPGPVVPGTGGYRVLTRRREVERLLETLGPDRLEVSDRTTLRWTGPWARAHGVRSMMVSHESLDGLLRTVVPSRRLVAPAADRLNAATARAYDVIACTTTWAAAEFARIGVGHVAHVPLGVDLDTFHPDRYDDDLRRWFAPNGEALLVHCGRLSREKRPDLSIAALAELRRHGVPAVLVVAGDGPLRRSTERLASGLLVRFLGFVGDRGRLSRLLATADVALAPGPIETFGLAALEALASGTPAVVNSRSALPEVVGAAGVAADEGDGPGATSFADAVREILARPKVDREARARARAEEFGWPAAVEGFLVAHGVRGRTATTAVSGIDGPPQSIDRQHV